MFGQLQFDAFVELLFYCLFPTFCLQLLSFSRIAIGLNCRAWDDTFSLFHSANTVAKCVYGISDTLATNIFAQSGKCRVECIYFPCDTAPELETLSPKGFVKVFPRKIDLQNVKNLKKFERTTVVMSFNELKKEVLKREKWLKKFSS